MMIEEKAKVQECSVAEVKAFLDRNEILLVDVRETSEYEKEHIAGSVLLPLSSFEPDMFPSLPGKKVILHCAVGKRSEAAGKMLLNEDYPTIAHMTGGLAEWKAAGYATEVQILPPDAEKAQAPVFSCPAPGKVLQDEYMSPLGITKDDLAQRINVMEGTLDGVLSGQTKVEVEMSLRLARFFSTAADFWVHLQLEHDLERARHAIGEQIRKDITPRTAS